MFDDKEKEALIKVIESQCLSDYQGNYSEKFYGGPEIRKLEDKLCKKFKSKHAIVCNSATSALMACCAAIGLQRNIQKAYHESDQVIVTPYSMTCSATVPLHFNTEPVFCDIEKDYYCLDPKELEKTITKYTKAIIVVDLFGQPYNVKKINEIAKKHNLIVIEDAAQAIGAMYKDKYAGTLGDLGVISFNHHKHISCGEGGAVLTDNDRYALKARLYINHAEAVINDYFCKVHLVNTGIIENSINMFGQNLRMTELQAAVANIQLDKLDGILHKVRKDYEKYFKDIIKIRPGCKHSFYRYAFSNDTPISNEIYSDFQMKKNYIKPIYKMPIFETQGYRAECKNCEAIEKNIVLAWR